MIPTYLKSRSYQPANPDTLYHPSDQKTFTKTIPLPKDFFIAGADAAYQVEGTPPDSLPTIWDTFTTQKKLTPADLGIGRYQHYQKHAQLIINLGSKHYRTSISISRILNKNGQPNQKAITWYQNYFKLLQKANIKIYPTLYHWELPAYLKNGWKNPQSVDLLVKHAQVVTKHLDQYIEEYFVLNEPWCSSLLSYHLGIHAPGETNLQGALLAAHHLLLGNAKALKANKTKKPQPKVSTVLNFEPAYPATNSKSNLTAANLADGYYNRWFIDPIYKGSYPKHMIKHYTKNNVMPQLEKKDLSTIHLGSKLHSLGVNYYRPSLVKSLDNPKPNQPPYQSIVLKDEPTNDLGWPINPIGLFDLLNQLYSEYKSHGLNQIYITENGLALNTPLNPQTKTINDSKRIQFFKQHFYQVVKAIKADIPIKGFFIWTLFDNFEWSEGYKPESCFGFIHVDKNQQCFPKKSYFWLQKLIKSRLLAP